MGQTWQHTALDPHLEDRVPVPVTLRPCLKQTIKDVAGNLHKWRTSIKSIGALESVGIGDEIKEEVTV